MNIILLDGDDLPIDYLQGMPAFAARTDFVDFPNSTLTIPLCAPSRWVTFSGRYGRTTGVSNNAENNLAFHGGVPEAGLIAPALARAGYHCAHVGKYQNNWPWNAFGGNNQFVPEGWDDFRHHTVGTYFNYSFVDNGQVTAYGSAEADYVTDQESIRVNDIVTNAPEPFFLNVGLRAPHGENNASWPPAPRHAATPVTIEQRPNYNEADISDKPQWLRNYRPNPMSTTEKNNLATWHADAIRTMLAVDELIASMIAALEARDILDDTVIAWMGDNGYLFGEHRYFTKACAFEEATRMHLKVRWPGVPGGSNPALVSNLDLAPTFTDIAGVAGRQTHAPEGMSFKPLITGEVTNWRDAVMIQRDAEDPLDYKVIGYDGLRTLTHKYVEYVNGDVELYDLTADPYELTNLAGLPEHADLQAELSRKLAVLKTG